MTVPVAAQYLPISPNSPSIHQIAQGKSSVQADAATLAQRLNTQGSLQLANGQPQVALQTWQEAEKAYAQAKDEMGVLGSKINQAQALQSLGMFRRSLDILEQVQQAIAIQPNSEVKATGLRSLGLAWQAVGD
ncbi:MAG TPA: hypothetical protein V6C93_12535, partial [Allocoleopsis sp.]